MAKTLTTGDDFTLPVTFDDCKTKDEIEDKRIRIKNDNTIFLNSVLALLTNKDKPFVHDENLQLFLEYIDSERPEIQDRTNTLKYIRENRDAWFESGEVEQKKQNVIKIFEFVRDNMTLIDHTPEVFGKQIDLNFAVTRALTEDDFDMSDKNNEITTSWQKLAKETRKNYTPQNLYSKQ